MTTPQSAIKITPAQVRALAMIEAAGTVYAYDGVSVSTARALAARGLVTLTHLGVTSTHNRRSGRTHYTADWKVEAL